MSKIKIMTIKTDVYITENEGIKQEISSSNHPAAKVFATEYLNKFVNVQPSIIEDVVKKVGESMFANSNANKKH
ncbi:hypothetical protein PGS50_03975 [Yersinia intermedia]|uniref:hypothetical protein n=1 Tax=Yersinia intermedia TaxID=631 RepID=UPI0022FF27C2|nr:hypothetical protein [Yersinia intermedia]MDA5492412.1 hypothetical protein [Yersinia intermedia]